MLETEEKTYTLDELVGKEVEHIYATHHGEKIGTPVKAYCGAMTVVDGRHIHSSSELWPGLCPECVKVFKEKEARLWGLR